MQIRHAETNDLNEILEIYAYARKFMAENGNPHQWYDYHPCREIVEQDIADGKSYVCLDGEHIAGVFFYDEYDDPTYREIDGAWLNSGKYGVVHRIAVAANKKGAGSFCLQWAYEQCKNLKIDTHEDNIPMQHLLNKLGFIYCGIIKLENGSPRIAFQKC